MTFLFNDPKIHKQLYLQALIKGSLNIPLKGSHLSLFATAPVQGPPFLCSDKHICRACQKLSDAHLLTPRYPFFMGFVCAALITKNGNSRMSTFKYPKIRGINKCSKETIAKA